jgi:hypothetical protein
MTCFSRLSVFIVAATGAGAAPAPFNNGVANVASELDGPVAPGEMVVIYGNGLGPATTALYQITPADFLDTLTGNTTVTFDGIPAPPVLRAGRTDHSPRSLLRRRPNQHSDGGDLQRRLFSAHEGRRCALLPACFPPTCRAGGHKPSSGHSAKPDRRRQPTLPRG